MDQSEKMLKGDEGEALRFYWGTDRNNFQSELLNRPVYDEVLYLEILTPGSRESSPVYEVVRRYPKETDLAETRNISIFQRYQRQIDHYMAGNVDSQEMSGTPLDRLSFLEKSQVATLNEGRIYTVEGLAALSDEKLRVLGMEGRTLRSRAQAYLEDSRGGEAVAQLTQQVADLTERLDTVLKRAEDAEKALAATDDGKSAALQKTADKTAKPVDPPVSTDKPDAKVEAPAKVDSSDII